MTRVNEGSHSFIYDAPTRLSTSGTRHRASTSTRWHFAFALCCYSNATRAPIANPPNSAQLGGIPYRPPSYIRVRAIVWACGRRQTDTQTRVTTVHFASSTTHAKCNESCLPVTPRSRASSHLGWYSFSVPLVTHARTSTRWHFVFALCCHSNATRAPIANPPNSAQLGGIPYHSQAQGLASTRLWSYDRRALTFLVIKYHTLV